MSAHINDLKEYLDMDPEAKANILLGNGLSIGVSRLFAYSSLKRVALRERFLDSSDDALFEQLQTFDFELVLRRLRIASEINRVLGQPHDIHDRKYRDLKIALVKSVRFVHPEHNEVSWDWLKGVGKELTSYTKIFTTNYDLILYWIIASVGFKHFVDFFFTNEGDYLKFDLQNTEPWFNQTEVYYLHGALFFFSEDGFVQKIKSSLANQLQRFIRWHVVIRNQPPLFISEGTFQEKQKLIAQSQYLSFAFKQFNVMKAGLTIYGHALNEEADKHLIEAINRNPQLKYLAISIYTHNQSLEGLVTSMNSYLTKFAPFTNRGGRVEFFGYERYGLPF